jgi:preprotein translocase subunit SecE
MAESEKKSFKTRIILMMKSLQRLYKDVRSEMKRVIWPNREQLINNTATVLLSCLLIGAVIWIADAGFAQLSALVFTR